jgi:hypothetical protein
MYQGLNCMDPVNSTVWQFLTDDFWNSFISSSIDVIWIWLLFIIIWFCVVSKWWWDLVNSLLSSTVWINQIATFYKQKTEIRVATDITINKTIPPITLLWSTVWLNQIATFYKQKAEICVATDITIQNNKFWGMPCSWVPLGCSMNSFFSISSSVLNVMAHYPMWTTSANNADLLSGLPCSIRVCRPASFHLLSAVSLRFHCTILVGGSPKCMCKHVTSQRSESVCPRGNPRGHPVINWSKKIFRMQRSKYIVLYKTVWYIVYLNCVPNLFVPKFENVPRSYSSMS